ncbi:hypothetical protein [Oligosphaera ethanolica]|uniref:Uncharacterized protein n=1 Tax=Oligosphaera ethanolica TaxID=760260 RepID=A0AAE3VHL6_9BACT|nr:hypothetical protein [Oligosphaera ethanolica]MDQ0290585.1 hypothetical protein [Oligosphaera ethanolica]
MNNIIEQARQSFIKCLRLDISMFLPAGLIGVATGLLIKTWVSGVEFWKQLLIHWFSGCIIGYLAATLVSALLFRSDQGSDSPSTLIRPVCSFIGAQAACLVCFSTSNLDAGAIPITLACVWGIPMGVTCQVSVRPAHIPACVSRDYIST